MFALQLFATHDRKQDDDQYNSANKYVFFSIYDKLLESTHQSQFLCPGLHLYLQLHKVAELQQVAEVQQVVEVQVHKVVQQLAQDYCTGN